MLQDKLQLELDDSLRPDTELLEEDNSLILSPKSARERLLDNLKRLSYTSNPGSGRRRSFIKPPSSCKSRRRRSADTVDARKSAGGTAVEPVNSKNMVYSYKDLIAPTEQDKIKQNIQSTFQLAKLITDFLSKFTMVYENFYTELDSLLCTYQQKTKDYSRDVSGTDYDQNSLKIAWQTLLQEMITDVKTYAEFASKVNQTGFARLEEIVTCKKLQMREMFDFRHNIDTMLDNSEEALHKLRVELRQDSHSFDNHRHHYTSGGLERKDKALAQCMESHNDYVLEINSTNKLLQVYHTQSLPWVLEELESVHRDTSSAVTSTIQNLSLLTVSRARDQAHRYDSVFSVCKQVNVNTDIQNFVRALKPGLDTEPGEQKSTEGLRKHAFQPVLTHSSTPKCLQKADIIFDKLIEPQIRSKRQLLLKESLELSRFVSEAEDQVVQLGSLLTRLLSGNSLSKVYDTQVELCRQKKALNIARLRLCVVENQIGCLTQKSVTISGAVDGQKTTTVKPSIKSMWKKFAKKASTAKSKKGDAQNRSPSHTSNDPGIDITLSIEDDRPHSIEPGTADPVYNLLKSASTLSKKNMHDGDSSGVSSMRSLPRQNTAGSGRSGSSRSSSPGGAVGSRVHFAGTRPRQMLNQRMKSFSLDAPDIPKPVDQTTKMKSSSYTNNTCIPGVNASPAHAKRRMQLMSQKRGLSVDMEDTAQSSSNHSSNPSLTSQTSPRHSGRPVPQTRTTLLEKRAEQNDKDRERTEIAPVSMGGSVNDQYVALYEFSPKEPGDLGLKPGDRVLVQDTSDPDWWFGSCGDQSGYFPYRYVLPGSAGRKVYQVIKPLHLASGDHDVRLLRDQVVIEHSSEGNGMIVIQTKNIKTGRLYELNCPERYLTEI